MANYFLDHGAYPAYAAVPTWNTAQEGDGKATGLATPAVASFLINAVAVATNTIAVAGVTLTAVASGATAVQFNVGASTTAQATNIATAINACTTNVGAAVATGTPQLRNLMYARAVGSTVEIMTRCGSADFNHASNANMALASAGWSAAPTPTQFAGGASGVWGYLFNVAVIWPSAVAANGYGVYKTGANAQPLHGPATLDAHRDFVYARTRGQTITMAANTTVVLNRNNLNIVYDDGGGAVAAWTGDTLPLTLEMVTSGANSSLRQITSAIVSEESLTYGRWIIHYVGTASAFCGPGVVSNATGEYSVTRVRFTNNGLGGISFNAWGAGSAGKFAMRSSRIEWPQNNIPTWFTSNTSSNNEILLEDVEIIWSGLSASPVAAFFVGTWINSRLVLKNVKLTGLPAPQKLYSGTTDRVVVIADSCEGFDLSGTLIGYGGVSRAAPVEQMYALLYNMGANRGYTFECTEGYVHWWPGQDFPTYTALLPDTTPWSLRLRWLANTTTAISSARPFQFWRTSQTVVTGSKTVVTVELLLDPAYASAITRSHLGIEVSYVSNVTSTRKTAYSVGSGVTAALASSAVAWTLGTTYAGYTKAKIALTLPDAIKPNTEIEVAMRAYLPAPTADQYVFIDPEIGLS